MRLGPPPEEPEVPGQFWIDFIRDTAPVFRKPTIEQLGEFIAPTFQALIDGADVRPAAARGDHRRARSRTRSSRTTSSASPRSCRRPRRGSGSCRATRPRSRTRAWRRSRRATRPPTGPRGRRSSTRSTGRIASMWTAFDAFCRERGLPAACRGRAPARTSCTSRPFLNIYSYPAEADYDAIGAARARRGTSSTRRSAPPTRRGSCPTSSRAATGALIYLSLGQPRVGGRGAHAAARRPPGADAPPGDRLEGAARGPDHAPRQHDRRGVPAPAGDPAPGRPRDHARRQQHGGRELPPRQADDRAAAVLGPGRQRAAGPRDRVRAAARDVRLRGRRAAGRRRRAPRRRGAAGPPRRGLDPHAGDRRGRCAPPTSSSASR